MSSYDNRFTGGVGIGRMPVLNSYSKQVRWVDSNGGANGDGSFKRPFATIVLALAVLGAGEHIFAKEAHSETVLAAAGITQSVAGSSVVGLGNGNRKPTVNFTTSAAATWLISGVDCLVQGMRFTCGIASQVTMFDVTAKRATIMGNDFAEGTATGLAFIAVTGVANAADGLQIVGNDFYTTTAGNYNHAIGLNEVNDNVRVTDNRIYGAFALSGLHNITGKVLTNLRIERNHIRNITAAKRALQLISACTGVSSNNRYFGGDTTVEAAAFGTAMLTEGDIGNNASLDAGSTFVISKTVTSSTITQAGVDLTAASIGGALEVVDVKVQTGATGLAAGTNFQVTSNNASGLAVMFAETVANLGANKTMNLANASVTKTGGVLESGKKFVLKSTVADCTGAGTIDVYITLRRLTGGANVVTV